VVVVVVAVVVVEAEVEVAVDNNLVDWMDTDCMDHNKDIVVEVAVEVVVEDNSHLVLPRIN
jgi:hypothetical protein